MIAVNALILGTTAILSASLCFGAVKNCDNCAKKINRFCCARTKKIWRTNPGKKICCDFTTSGHTPGPRFKQEGQDCGVCFSPPTYDAGTCAPGLECRHFNPEIHEEKKHLHIDKPGICVRPVTPGPSFKQEGQDCGVCFCPPTYYAGTCAPGLECKHFNPEIHAEKKHLHIVKPGICVRPPKFNPKCAEAGESCKSRRCCTGLDCVQSGSDSVCLV